MYIYNTYFIYDIRTFFKIMLHMIFFVVGFAEMVSRDLTFTIKSTEMIKELISDWLSYRQPYKRFTVEEKLNRDLSKFIVHDQGYMKMAFFHYIASDHLNRMSGAFFHFNIDIVGQLESFETDWNKKIIGEYPILKNFKFDMKSGRHRTSVNHPAFKNKKQQASKLKDPQKTRFYYKELINTDKTVLRALCHMVLIDYVCFPQYKLPVECQDMEINIIQTRKLLVDANN